MRHNTSAVGSAVGTERVDAAAVATWSCALADHLCADDDAAKLALIEELERLTCAAAAAQAMLAVELDLSQRAKQARAGVPVERRGRGVAAQLALARRESPHLGQRHLGLAKILHGEMPCTWAAFRQGWITEWSATILARETACLSLEDRRAVDEAVAADGEAVERMGTRALEAMARRLAYRLDPQAWVARRAAAEHDRRVTLRPAPDVMSHLSALVPAV